jgi:dienelactone hydrolase
MKIFLLVLILLFYGSFNSFAQDPEPGSAEWYQRDLENMARMTGRTIDQVTNPLFVEKLGVEGNTLFMDNIMDQIAHPTRPIVSLSQLLPGGRAADPFRRDWELQGRGIMIPIEYENRYGARIQGEVWAPSMPFVDPVTGETSSGPFPAIVITTGSVQGFKELYWWAAQGLAEAGYVVMTYDVQGQGKSEVFGHDENGFFLYQDGGFPGFPFQQDANFIEGTEDALEWFLSDANPLLGLVDQDRLGLASHSLGASAVTLVGNQDPRIKVVVAWDNASLPEDQEPMVPTMGINAEAFFTPQPQTSAPDPDAKRGTFLRFKEKGVPAMQIALRGSTHLEFTYVPLILPASVDGERVAMYYTLAWFDRWLKGERLGRSKTEVSGTSVLTQCADAVRRLTAKQFDDSADCSAIGTGKYDIATNSNVPYMLEGKDVAEYLSFYYLSAGAFTGKNEGDDGNYYYYDYECEDMRTSEWGSTQVASIPPEDEDSGETGGRQCFIATAGGLPGSQSGLAMFILGVIMFIGAMIRVFRYREIGKNADKIC